MKIKTSILTTLLFAFTAVSQAQNITSEAVMYFKLDEQQTETIPVNSTNNKSGKFNGSAIPGEVINDPEYGWVRSSVAGKTGMGLFQKMPVDGTSVRTISFWAYVNKQCLSPKGTQIIQGNAQIISVGAATEPHGLFQLQVYRGNSIRLTTDKQASCNILFEGTEDLRDAWHHYTIVIENGGATEKIRAYVDGKLLPAGQAVDVSGKSINHYVINTTQSAGTLHPMLTGKLADFIIFDRALRDDEVIEVMNITK